jgi:hypothetical protein
MDYKLEIGKNEVLKIQKIVGKKEKGGDYYIIDKMILLGSNGPKSDESKLIIKKLNVIYSKDIVNEETKIRRGVPVVQKSIVTEEKKLYGEFILDVKHDRFSFKIDDHIKCECGDHYFSYTDFYINLS